MASDNILLQNKDDNIQKDEARQSDRQTMTNISDFTFTIKETKTKFDI